MVDTSLRTADSGYLTRRLLDVAQDIIVRDEDCLTTEGLSYEDLFTRYRTSLSYKDRLIGRLLLEPVFSKDKTTLLAPANTELTVSVITELEKHNIQAVKVRSPLTCNSNRSVCRKCYGWHLSYSRSQQSNTKTLKLGAKECIIAATLSDSANQSCLKKAKT